MVPLVREFARFVRENKRFVVVPLLVLAAVALALALLLRGGASPYEYGLN